MTPAGPTDPRQETGLIRQLRAFMRQEDGVIGLQFLWQFPFMMWFGYIGIDVMMHEYERTRLQNTLDRAILAAADLDQEADPESVVRSYFRAAGIEDSLASVDVVQGLNLREVTATADLQVNTFFLGGTRSGYRKSDNPYIYNETTGEYDNYYTEDRTLSAKASGAAQEAVSNVEVSLVLDISGSMGSNSRIQNMRSAATDFVNTVVKESEDGITTVSIVPYNATVNLGSSLGDKYNLRASHDYSRCAAFDSSDFYSTSVSTTTEIDRLAHFDPYSSSQSSTSISSPWCAASDYAQIMPMSADTGALETFIYSLNAGGNTAIDLGMKWGVALLDPSAQPAIQQLVDDGEVDSRAASRPAAFSDEETMKVVVLMTDGENTSQYDLRETYKDGLSDVWVDDRGTSSKSDDRFSYDLSDYVGYTQYFWERYEYDRDSRKKYRSTIDGGSSAEQMRNVDVFARWGTGARGYKFFERPYYDRKVSYSNFYDQYYSYEETVSGSQANNNLSNICAAARDNNIVIFTVAFEAPSNGQTAMRDCASSESHYFTVEGLEIDEVFAAIARQINQLKLIQ